MLQSSIAKWLHKPSSLEEGAAGHGVTPIESADASTSANESSSEVLQRGLDEEGSSEPPLETTLSSGNSKLLAKNVTIARCTEEYLQSYRRLTSTLLPIPYPDSFFKETMNDSIINSVTRVALWHDTVQSIALPYTVSRDLEEDNDTRGRLVAAIRCRILVQSTRDHSHEPILYISTIGVLAPFRGHGLASHLLQNVTQIASEQHGITAVTAHVWEANEDAKQWYMKRGFCIVAKEDQYYKRLAPQSAALVMRKDLVATSQATSGKVHSKHDIASKYR